MNKNKKYLKIIVNAIAQQNMQIVSLTTNKHYKFKLLFANKHFTVVFSTTPARLFNNKQISKMLVKYYNQHCAMFNN